jgi:ribose transport system substrate-binding protein
MSRKVFVALTIAACLSAGGCGAKVVQKYRIAVIPKGLTHEFWQSIHRGSDRAASDFQALGIGVEIQFDGPRIESDAREQINLVDTKAGMGIQGLILAPQDSKGMVPVVERTVDKGIPVVIIDSGLDPDALKLRPDLIVKYVATDNYHGGELAAQRLVEVLTMAGVEAPKVVLFRYAPGSESTEQREQGFLDQIDKENAARKKAGKPAVEIISKDKYAGPTVDTAEREASPLLIQIKDRADGIFAVNESAATGMLNALRSQKLNKKIHLVGFDSSEPLLQAVEEGDVEGLIVQDPYRMGYLAVWTLVRHLEGDDVRTEKNYISTGEYLLTKENLHSEESRARFDRQAQARRTIQKPEFKKK